MPPGVADRGRVHAGQLPEHPLGAPEAAHPEVRRPAGPRATGPSAGCRARCGGRRTGISASRPGSASSGVGRSSFLCRRNTVSSFSECGTGSCPPCRNTGDRPQECPVRAARPRCVARTRPPPRRRRTWCAARRSRAGRRPWCGARRGRAGAATDWRHLVVHRHERPAGAQPRLDRDATAAARSRTTAPAASAAGRPGSPRAARGTTSTCPLNTGRMSRNATHSSVEATANAGHRAGDDRAEQATGHAAQP